MVNTSEAGLGELPALVRNIPIFEVMHLGCSIIVIIGFNSVRCALPVMPLSSFLNIWRNTIYSQLLHSGPISFSLCLTLNPHRIAAPWPSTPATGLSDRRILCKKVVGNASN